MPALVSRIAVGKTVGVTDWKKQLNPTVQGSYITPLLYSNISILEILSPINTIYDYIAWNR
jgi:hypothetical protein